MKTYKAFDKTLSCQKKQYKIGKEYSVLPEQVKICSSGFHSCLNPFDILRFYPMIGSRFAEVEADGKIEQQKENSKVCSEKIKIVEEAKGEIVSLVVKATEKLLESHQDEKFDEKAINQIKKM